MRFPAEKRLFLNGWPYRRMRPSGWTARTASQSISNESQDHKITVYIIAGRTVPTLPLVYRLGQHYCRAQHCPWFRGLGSDLVGRGDHLHPTTTSPSPPPRHLQNSSFSIQNFSFLTYNFSFECKIHMFYSPRSPAPSAPLPAPRNIPAQCDISTDQRHRVMVDSSILRNV